MILNIISKELFLFYLLLFLTEILHWLHLFLEIFRIFCVIRITLDFLRRYNQYREPLNIFRIITTPYLRFCKSLVPKIIPKRKDYDISKPIALKIISLSIKLTCSLRFLCLKIIKNYFN